MSVSDASSPGAASAILREHRDLCPRLLDYFCIVGTDDLGDVGHRHAATVKSPQLLRRYPPTDHKVGIFILQQVKT